MTPDGAEGRTLAGGDVMTQGVPSPPDWQQLIL